MYQPTTDSISRVVHVVGNRATYTGGQIVLVRSIHVPSNQYVQGLPAFTILQDVEIFKLS